jgi:ring-1,2-phenylacetyl-CoA epoxidase subunit PaaE
MGFFSRKKKEESTNSSTTTPKGFYALQVKSVESITPESVQISFQIPIELKNTFTFIPGQYLNLCANIDGFEARRSYSICSGQNEDLAVAIKRINNGTFSNWANDVLKAGDTLLVTPPMGNFQLHETSKKIVAFAAGSGITPLISMAKSLEAGGGEMKLFYGNRTLKSIPVSYTHLRAHETG